jgi:hypothetical protein
MSTDPASGQPTLDSVDSNVTDLAQSLHDCLALIQDHRSKLPKRLTLLLCLIYSAQVQTRDYLVEMFLKQMKKISIRATEELQSIKEKQQTTTEKLVSVLTDILQVFNGESVADDSSRQVTPSSLEQLQTIFTKTGGVEYLLSECEEINAYQGNNHLPLM